MLKLAEEKEAVGRKVKTKVEEVEKLSEELR